jgi:ribosome-binding factor A
LGFVTFTDARVTPDLMQARLFYTVFGSDVDKALTVAILQKNTGRLRGEIGKQLGIRMTPTLELILDDVPENAGDLNDLLAEAKRRDGELEKLAKGAKHAGDVDPYIQKPQED